ncbi:7380_t:CDS:1 [Funneliformis geosporum]|uniref:19583_t:CDS:1 n=1 Tax=Funneliformis geosporum TaxID=1117311 RepID=A0A9W4SLD6_9GLOM|nr:7380_t:CDS:1 [Funneliformis geosporum]CAI2173701.1 19583_t:CDS:1 [Funneliformis geosporum]
MTLNKVNKIKVSNKNIYLEKSSATILPTFNHIYSINTFLYPSTILSTNNHTISTKTNHHHPFSMIPIEILPHICKYLAPKDLAALALVCKEFSEILYLNNKNSSIWPICQAIWRESRLYVLPKYKKPPLRMSERKYTIMMCGTNWKWDTFYRNSSTFVIFTRFFFLKDDQQ